jgi:hypothetical protein
MPYRFDNPVTTSVGQSYVVKSDHRDGSKKKSQWIIAPQEEVNTFEGAYSLSWTSTSGQQAWGLHLVDGRPTILGTAPTKLGTTHRGPSRTERLWLAKFVRNATPVFWHGYPANYRHKSQDRPPVSVLQAWHDCGYISKREISRIRGSKPCSLSD